MFEINHINVSYGEVQALFDVSVRIEEKEIVSIIGANGAGKSTLMKTIAGINRVKSGDITFAQTKISNMRPHDIVKLGIVYVPEGRLIFPDMTVTDNLEMGAYSRNYSKKMLRIKIEEQCALFPVLGQRKKQLAGLLSGGEQQMLAIARGLISEPKFLLLDEPSLGLAPVIVDEVFAAIQHVNESRKIPIMLVEQNAFMALSISSRTYVLENGRVTIIGNSKELLERDEIKNAYLGG